MLKSMTLQLFPSLPPLQEVTATTRTLVGGGHLIQRELVDISGLGRLARERSLSAPDRETLERWDRDGLFSPMAFVIADGPTGSWRTTEPYPTGGLHFRDEHAYVPWEQLTAQLWEVRVTRPLYSPWQVMYLDTAREFDGVEVYVEAMLEGGERLVTWAADHLAFVEQHVGWRGRWQALWLPLMKLLTRLQSRYWPFIRGRSVLLIDPASNDYVDAIDLEYENTTPAQARGELGASYDELRITYEWLVRRWRMLDPVPDLYPLLRLEPRVRRERRTGVALQALDYQDAAGMMRRFLRDLDGQLPPDLDQIDDPGAQPRPMRRDRSQLQEALREAGLYPHRLHMVVEGATEERLIRRLFLAFAGPWEGSGLAITDIGGDKLKGSRTMLEGFGVYADAVALLLDDENEARRVTEQLAHGGVVIGDHVKLWERSLEEDNFTPAELLAMVGQLANAKGARLTLTEDQLMVEQARVEARPGPRQALASTLQRMARQPEHGAVVYAKPDLAEPMADLIITEVERRPGRHEEVAGRRPIVAWILTYPVRAARN
jgi:hypothetical protein